MNQEVGADADVLTDRLKKLADRWRTKLQEPAIQDGIKTGQLAVSPLVRQLLAAYPDGGGQRQFCTVPVRPSLLAPVNPSDQS